MGCIHTPVSYTHLDYEKILQEVGFASVQTRYLLTSEISSAHLYTAVQQASNIDPVSYTHLDVYKRQD